MNRNQILSDIDERIEMLKEERINLEELRSFIRMILNEFFDELKHDLREVNSYVENL